MGMCSYQTAYHMLTSAKVKAGEHLLISGASGGVGTALVQLSRIMGAVPHCISSPGKAEGLKTLGAETVLDRTQSIRNTEFIGHLQREVSVSQHKGVESTITGRAFLLAHSDILVNPNDIIVNPAELPPLTVVN